MTSIKEDLRPAIRPILKDGDWDQINLAGPMEEWRSVERVWIAAQVGLPLVPRWHQHPENDEHGGVRRQNSLQHSHSITRLGEMIMLQLLDHGVEFDDSLMKTAFSIHDEGEGVIGEDTLYKDKTDEQDLAEYVGFLSIYEYLESNIFDYFNRAFLLQFAIKNPVNFPYQARMVMHVLSTVSTRECHLFEAVERFDYIMYALEQYQFRGNEKIFTQTLRNQIPKLNRIVEMTGIGFGKIWTPEIHSWCQEFVKEREGLWIE